MLTFDYDFGLFGTLIIAIAVAVGVIIVVFVAAAAKTARDTVVEEDQDRRFHDGRDEHGGPLA